MSVLDAVIKPMHPEGRRFVAIAAAITVLLFLIDEVPGLLGVALTIWVYYFFRDPKRAVPQREGLMVAPADGIVSQIEAAAPPPELGMGETPLTRVSIFMNVFNCHVNRAPAAGEVVAVAYRPGRFFNASLDKASEHNERNSLRLRLEDGREIAVVQIAGLVARRIVSWVEEGQTLRRGERFGLIRFGSRVDVYLPEGVAPQVCLGQTTIAGETVIADLAHDLPPCAARLE